MSPNGQARGKKVTVPDNIYTIIIRLFLLWRYVQFWLLPRLSLTSAIRSTARYSKSQRKFHY